MSFKPFLYIILCLSIPVGSSAQKVKNKYNWKYIGPKTVAESNLDSGSWTSTGMGWVESFLEVDGHFYAGSITGGLYKTKNEGKSWKKIDDDPVQLGCLDLSEKDGIIYRATGLTHYDEVFGNGLMQSVDGGKTWNQNALAFLYQEKQALWVVESNAFNSHFIACSQDKIYHSSDGALSWGEVYASEKPNWRSALFLSDERSALVSGSRLMLSRNHGAEWLDITENLSGFAKSKKTPLQLRISICEDPSKPGRLLCAYSLRNQVFIDESLDYGETWLNLHKSFKIRRLDIHHNEIGIPPGNPDCIVIAGVRTFISLDRGKTFNQVSFPIKDHPQFAHDDIRDLYLKSASEFYISTDGGVFKSTDTAKTWVDISGKGLLISQVYGVGLLPNEEILYGCQDLGTFYYKNDDWLSIGKLYGDGGDNMAFNGNAVVLANGRMQRLNLKTLTPRFIHPSSKSTPFVSKIYANPKDSTSLFFAVDDLWRYQDSKWTNLTRTVNNQKFKASGFNIASDGTMYFSYDQPTWNPDQLNGKFFKSEDEGESWDDITANLPILAWRYISTITTNPSNPNEIYVGLGILGNTEGEIHKVYKSMDGGTTWINFSKGLSRFETFKIVFIEGSTSGLLVSVKDGMYYRNDGMEEWQKLKGKIPPIAIRDFEIDYENRKIISGTYGNGMWRMKMPKKMMLF